MRVIRAVIIILLLSATPASGADGPGTRNPGPAEDAALAPAVAREVDRVKGLNGTELLQWTQETLQRFHLANLALFQSAEVYHRYDWGKQMAAEIARNGPQKDTAIGYLAQELAKAEDAAFARLQRDFKQAVLKYLDSDPAEQKQRLETWDRLFNQWQASGGSVSDRARLIVWLREAIQKQRLGAVDLPPFPELGSQKEEKNLLGGSAVPGPDRTEGLEGGIIDWSKWKIEQMVSITRRPVEKSPELSSSHPELVAIPRASSIPRNDPTTEVLDRVELSLTVPGRPAPVRLSPDRIPGDPALRAGSIARTWRTTPSQFVPFPRADFPGGIAQASRPGSLAAKDTPPARAHAVRDASGGGPVNPARETPGGGAETPRTATLAPRREAEPVVVSYPSGRYIPRANRVVELPPATAFVPELSNPAHSAPETSPASLLPRSRSTPAPFARVEPPMVGRSPSVNVQKLNTLVRGYNLAVKELETAIDAPREWNARNLTPVVGQLRDLTLRERDLRIFEQLVPEDEREYLEGIHSLNPAIARIATAIYEARNRAMRDTGLARIRYREMEDLQDLSEQLARLASQP